MKLSFFWRRDAGEAVMSKADADRIRAMARNKYEWVTAADFAKDAMEQATELYEEVLALAREANGAKA